MEYAIIAVVGVVLLILVIWFFSTWNRLVSLEENANNAWSNIDVLLNQRYDMIPNLVNMVKGYAAHEKEIFEQFAQARNRSRCSCTRRRQRRGCCRGDARRLDSSNQHGR